ncbi:50S ribosomal protein L15 [Candidatus Liberibacter africanus]|uniref:Large ribosomal subunit protein uL15 n=1 Tax=Candidatus Liberibacter africanus PTSAPSY TaxID=1277257 RepID=A0A0G3I1Q7_LIBAF|nr:50S ribosomal protein L15 [Candidatus Liberibacter africanus]AKK19811.1 50S ribosomal protein L15 [Candidatus Liberibacter africanus PTSAPSY]QTP63675.1 50S ribosomal protein L15 [Candidatus Liberibacter africanus]
MKLNEIHCYKGSCKTKKRIARGIGSGTGKTAGRGVKGQKSRSGVSIRGFEGGQMPLYRRLPKRGFVNISSSSFVTISLGRLQSCIDKGKLDFSSEIDANTLLSSGIIRRCQKGVRVLSDGDLKSKVVLRVSGASASAVAKIEKLGGKVIIV